MRMITGKTSLVGVLGQPIGHSLSPIMHNAAFNEMGLDWCYVAIPCDPKDLWMVINALNAMNYKGLNITIPHKQKAINVCNKVSPLAKRLKAVNTLVPNATGGWTGTNTDLEGFLAPLKTNNWQGRKAVVVGCGGSARAVVASLQDLKVNEITIVGRKADTLQKFLEDLQKGAPSTSSLQGLLKENQELIEHIKMADLVVNTTPIGMKQNPNINQQLGDMPLGKDIWSSLKKESTLYDLIYSPQATPWLEFGKNNGHQTINGLEMLVQQGAASLRLWSNNENVPVEVMKKAAEKYLGALK